MVFTLDYVYHINSILTTVHGYSINNCQNYWGAKPAFAPPSPPLKIWGGGGGEGAVALPVPTPISYASLKR